MTSISLQRAPWHLLASHLFGSLLIWRSLGDDGCVLGSPLTGDSSALHCVLLLCNHLPHGLQPYSVKYSHRLACGGVWRRFERERHSGFILPRKHTDLMCCISLHEGTQAPLSWYGVNFDLHATPARFPPLRLASSSSEGHGHAADLITLDICQKACELSLFMNSGLRASQEEDKGRSPRIWVQRHQPAALPHTPPRRRPQLRSLHCLPRVNHRTHVCASNQGQAWIIFHQVCTTWVCSGILWEFLLFERDLLDVLSESLAGMWWIYKNDSTEPLPFYPVKLIV